MDKLNNAFLVRLFKADKLLFVVIGLYLLGLTYFTLRQREEFPFLHYAMYSLKEPGQETYVSYSIVLDNHEVKYTKLRNAQKGLVITPLQHFIALLEAGKISDADAVRFKTWLLMYIADMHLAGDNNMNVFKLTCNYDEHGVPHVLKKELVYTYATAE